MWKWCKWIVAGLFWLAHPAGGAAPAAVEVPPARDLEQAGRVAEQRCVPLLLELSARYCEYCVLLEEEVLKPLLRNREYDTRVLMRKLEIDKPRNLKDFDGKQRTVQALARRYHVDLTPTLLFVDSEGNELAERMIGVMTLDFYAGYLDRALDNASRRLRESGRCR